MPTMYQDPQVATLKDLVMSLVPENCNSSEMQEIMSLLPAPKAHIDGEDSKRRPDTMTIEDLKAESQKILENLFEVWAQLRTIRSQHKSCIEKRWRKKTEDQRMTLLTMVCPGIPPMHRPDFMASRKKFRRKDLPFSLDIALRLPCINLEDLSGPNALLLFLESRSNNFPALFTNADRSQLRVGIKSKVLIPEYVRGYTMYMSGEQTREGYGRIVSWVQDPASANLLGTPSQNALLTPQDLHRPPQSCLPHCGQILLLGECTFEAPYRAPQMFNFARLSSLVQGRSGEVMDHFLSTQEDPSYFAETIQAENVDIAYLTHGHRATVKESTHNFAVLWALNRTYYEVFRWDVVSSFFDQLNVAYEAQKESLQPGKSLPDAFGRALTPFICLLDMIIAEQLTCLPPYLSRAPGFEKQINAKLLGKSQWQQDDYLVWLFQEVLKDDKNRICDIHSILQEIEIHIKRRPQVRAQLTPGMIHHISELSVMAELQQELGLLTCNEYFRTTMLPEEIQALLAPSFIPLNNILDVLGEVGSGIGSYIRDLRLLDYPCDKPRTRANTAKMRSAEQALDDFWEQVDHHVKRQTGKTLKELEDNRLSRRPIERTPPWQEVNVPLNEALLPSKDTNVPDAALALARLEMLTESTIAKGQISEARQKVKTRNPTAFETDAGGPIPAMGITIPETQPEATKVKLRKKAYKAAFPTFAKIFGKPVTNQLSGKIVEELSGKIPWHQFLTAMSRAGFAAEKLQGSRWLFRSGNRSIMFHEPHPENDLTTHLARRFARRLKGNFGWTTETFVLDDTKEEGTLAPSDN
ncbi:MAG: hypothetical protein Q9169_007108 [Polycauliona sp. 2 TL-2023]